MYHCRKCHEKLSPQVLGLCPPCDKIEYVNSSRSFAEYHAANVFSSSIRTKGSDTRAKKLMVRENP